jgi:predicted dehydrogenase
MTATTFKVGMIGAGWVARDRHVPSFQAVPGVEITAVYDRHPGRAERFAADLGIPTVAGGSDDLLGLGLDAVSIATPPWFHADLAIAALRAGLHVFCEKPMAMTVAEGRAMVDAASSAGRLLTISHNFLFSRSFRRAQRHLGPSPDLEYVGAIQLSSDRRRLPDWFRSLPGGLLFDESPHIVYTLGALAGPLRLVSATATWRDDGHPAVVEAQFQGSVPAHATMVFGAPVSEWHVLAVGRRRLADIDLFRDVTVRLGSDGAHQARDIARTSAQALLEHATGFGSSGVELLRGRLRWGHDELIAAFVAACRGERDNPVDPASALATLQVTEAVLDAIGARSEEPHAGADAAVAGARP